MRVLLLTTCLVAAVLCVCRVRTSAAVSTGTFSAQASVTGVCSVSASSLAFGGYDPVFANATAALDSTAAIQVACTKGIAATIALDLGANASGTTRRMKNGTSFLVYDLFQDASRSRAWTSSGSGLLDAGTATSMAARSFTVYGRVPAGQDVPAGNYADTITVTVNY
jgi:spore coat protein U-like protein